MLWQEKNGQSGHEVAMALLRQLYREKTGHDLPEIARTPQGKPYFPHDDHYFSISHTHTHAFCCLHTQPVGIDAEPCGRPVNLALAQRYFSPAEQTQLAASADPNRTFLRLWVLKESYAKLTGKGIGNYLKSTNFSETSQLIQEIDGHYVSVLTENDCKELCYAV